jgi:hypothetical protein
LRSKWGAFLSEAIKACNWQPSEVEAVLIGMSAPVSEDYLDQITKAAGGFPKRLEGRDP